MIHSIRSFFQTKLGVGVTLAFVVLIGLVFAITSVSFNSGATSASGDTVATVGKERVGANDVERAASNYLSRLRKEDPTATMAAFLAKDGLNELIAYLVDRKAARLFGESHGIYVDDALVAKEIAKIPSVQGPDGKIDSARYRQFLSDRGQTDAEFRAEVAEGLMARQLLGSNDLGVVVPRKVSMRYAGMVTERRKGAIITLPAAAFAPKTPPTEGEITEWYNSHKADYSLPERRTIRYIVFGDNVLKSVPAPNDAEIAARYNATKASRFAATDKRKLSQMVLPTEAAAKQVMTEVAAGKTLEASATAKGLAVASLGTLTKEEYSLQSSGATADTVFAAPKGKVMGPYKAPLGWLIVRVDGLEATPGKTLDQARPEVVKELTEEKRREAIAEFSARIEDNIANGATLSDVAKDLGANVQETAPLTANGGVFGKPGATAPKELAPVLQAAFMMEGEKQPQLAEVEPGKTFMIFDVGTVTTAAPPPLTEIRQQVIADLQLSKGAKLAKAAAEKVKAQIEKGVPPEVALASLGIALPPVDKVDKARMEVQAQGPNAPKPELLLFSMAKGKVRLLAAPRNRGWYVVAVTEVTPGTVAADDKRLPGLEQSLQSTTGGEYAEQMRGGMRNEVGSTRNEGNTGTLKKRLEGAR